MELLGQKSAVLASQVQNAAEKLQLLRDRQQEVQDSAARGDIGAEQLRAYNRLLVETESQLNHYQKSVIDVDKQIASLTGNTKSAAASAAVFVEAQKKEAEATEKAREEAKQHGKQLGALKESYKDAGPGAQSFSNITGDIALGTTIAAGIQKAASALWDFAQAGAESARNLELSQMQLTLILRNTVNASDDYVDSIKDLIDQQERLGVVSKNSQTAAAQELATYVTKKGTLEKLIPVLNDMIAQQYGVNASQQSAVSVATQLGKTLDGQVGSLQRWGYRFSEAEQEILKTGSEMRKLDVITRVVTDSVGGLSYSLRETTKEGEKFNRYLDIRDVQQRFGDSVESIKESLMASLLPSITTSLEAITVFVEKNGKSLESLGLIVSTVIDALAALLQIISALPPELTRTLAIVGAGVALFMKVNKALTTYNEGLAAASKASQAAAAGTRAVTGAVDPLTIKILSLAAALALILFLILAIREGSEKAGKAIEGIANQANKVPNTVKQNSSSVPGYAGGTRNAARGLAWVGENGPELVRFTGGEQVYTSAQSKRIASGSTSDGGTKATPTHIHYHGETIRVGHVKQLEDLVYRDENHTRISRQAGALV